jgi:hypothetical protein
LSDHLYLAMDNLIILLFLVALPLTTVYLWNMHAFCQILAVERPALLARRGSLSFFYDGMPRLADPNVSMAVLGAAPGRTARSLQHADAMCRAWCIRITLGLVLVLFVAMTLLWSWRGAA